MELIERFTWIITTILGILFIISLFILAQKPQVFSTQKNIKSKENLF